MLSLRRSLTFFTVLLALSANSCKKPPNPKLLYVSAEAGGEVVVVDPDSATVVAHIPVGKRPRGVKVSRDGKLLYVALSGSPRGGPNVDESKLPPPDRAADGVGVVDLSTRKLVRTFPSGQDPETFDVSLDGKTLYVSNEETAELTVLDLGAGTIVRKIAVGKEPEGVSVRPDGKVVYVTSEEDGTVTAIDTGTLAVLATIPVGLRPRAIAFDKDGSVGFVSNELGGTLSVFDANKNAFVGTVKIEARVIRGQRPMGLVLSRDGKQLFVSTGRGGAVAVVDVAKRDFDHMIEDV
ncbi:MAG TPA: hypothetical protein VGM29_12475, partial [Polyangiaceae bacterium]